MLRVIIATFITLALTGCMDSITKLPEPTDTSYYTIDLKDYSYCQGSSSTCHSLSTISTGTQFAGPVEDVYGTKISGPNYRGSLLRMILEPQGAPYTADKISENGRYYRVPANEHTDTVWKVLGDINDSLYNNRIISD
ncbi:hypothetical protein KDX31_16705 [Amphritea atlantica]|uniref:Cytochrome c domain-containing protein n=1 Tax=Amphritea atlantica TaxID=355243 RepID=A0ABY5GT61_9GAMM|nr:hypothetical protein KDX31_16705 [Amphritea atlantica]